MRTLRVLIVEDEMIIAWNLKSAFEKLGCSVLPIAATAEKAVSLSRQERPDLVTMDVMLRGDRSGIEAAAEIRAFSGVPIVFITANTDQIDDRVLTATRAQGVFVKPASEPDLRTILGFAEIEL